MKISKSKQELARIISENGGWRDGSEWAAQDKNHAGILRKVVFYCGDKPWFEAGEDYWGGNNTHDEFIISDMLIKNWHQTILSRDEYFSLYLAPDADGWIEWNGGECPVGDDVVVDVKTRDGEIEFDPAYFWNWSHEKSSCIQDKQIIAYRLHNPEQAKHEFCESVMRSIPEPSGRPTIEQLAAEYRNLFDLSRRKQQEADAAKDDADEALRKLELAGEAIGMLVSPITAKQEPELVITDWRDLRVGDVIWWCGDEDNEAGEYEVKQLESDDYDGFLTIAAGNYWVDYERDYWRFIRRP